MINDLLTGLESTSIQLSPLQEEQFQEYKDLIVEWNEKIDITAITDDWEIDNKHFLDSLTVFRKPWIKAGSSVIDIGTGGGFPGVPMKIVEPTLQITLLDSLQKRISFLDAVIGKLGLSGIRAFHARAEEVARKEKYRDSFDVCVSRAVAPLSTLLEYCLPYVKVGGIFIAMKGPGAQEEIDSAARALQALGGRIKEIDSFTMTEEAYQRNLIIVEKISPTPKKYPRGQGKPRKDPL